jgi:predicted aspartyl protease
MSLAVVFAVAATVAPLADVPFDDDFGLIFFEASIDGSEPITLLLDTGFDVSVLDADVAARLGLQVFDSRTEAQPGGSVETGRLAPVSLAIGGLRIDGLVLTTVPLTGAVAFVGRRVDGILGHDVLERYVVDIDYPKRRLRFRTSEGWHHSGPGQILPVSIEGSEVFLSAGIVMPTGRTVFGSFKLDTGSVDVAGLNLNFVSDSELLNSTIPVLKMDGVAVGGSTEGRLFRAAALIIGADRIEAPLIGYTVDSGGFENRDDAGTVGAAVLSRYRLILDYPRQRIILEQGPSSAENVAEDHSGMLVVSPGPEFDTLVIAQVIPGSPAAEAGLAAGDEITSMEGRSDWTLPDVRLALDRPGPINLVVRNDGESREVNLQRQRLLPLD